MTTPLRSIGRPLLPSAFAAAVTIGACLCLPGPVQPGPLVDAATAAEAKAAAGDAKGAYELVRKAVGDFAVGLPLTIGTGVFVTTVPTAFGIYEPRPNAVFKPGEALITYIEPIGLTWKQATADPAKQQTDFTVDFELLDTKGTILGSQKTFGQFSFVSFIRNQEIFAHLRMDITGAPAGDYVMRYTLNDTAGSRQVQLEQPFSIAP